jgi:hypothetical protein
MEIDLKKLNKKEQIKRDAARILRVNAKVAQGEMVTHSSSASPSMKRDLAKWTGAREKDTGEALPITFSHLKTGNIYRTGMGEERAIYRAGSDMAARLPSHGACV